MVLDRFYDFRDNQHAFEFIGWRCLNCGEILDSVVARNRQASATANHPGDKESPDAGLKRLAAEDKLIEPSWEHG
jgi:hypothetical protein